jgi:glycosyltransferase involved in cell wall biosynthesis
MDQSVDIIFLITGKPLPAMLDMAFYATNFGKKAAMMVLERNEEDLKLDTSLVNYEIITIFVSYKSVDLRRFTSIPSIYRKLKSGITNRLKPSGIIVTGSYDLLVFAQVLNRGKKYKIRHQVRDLHVLQLSGTFMSRIFVKFEKYLLKNVESVLVSSEAFADSYYKKIFKGDVILLDNTPSKNTWTGFNKKQLSKTLVIGFIGIIRYKISLNQLIDAVENLLLQGYSIKVIFAGGGKIDDLKSKLKFKDNFEFFGPYEYSKDIKNLYSKIDLIYAVYDSFDPNCQLAMPNKFYESIISKIPLLVASNTFVGKEVMRVGIGRTVLSGNVSDLEILLKEACENQGWFREASINLLSVDPEFYYDQYVRAMKSSVL